MVWCGVVCYGILQYSNSALQYSIVQYSVHDMCVGVVGVWSTDLIQWSMAQYSVYRVMQHIMLLCDMVCYGTLDYSNGTLYIIQCPYGVCIH